MPERQGLAILSCAVVLMALALVRPSSGMRIIVFALLLCAARSILTRALESRSVASGNAAASLSNIQEEAARPLREARFRTNP
jgi:hypothetical protein